MDLMTDFLTGYVGPAGASLADDPGLKGVATFDGRSPECL
jgi:hypothetical protein